MILSIDQGTTNTKAVLVDEAGQVVGYGRRTGGPGVAPARVGRAGRRRDLDERAGRRGRLSGVGLRTRTLAGVTVSNQRESVVAWRRSTGEPLGPVIGWQDRRTASWCTRLATPEADDQVRTRTGLRIDAMFSGPKMRWLLDQRAGRAERPTSAWAPSTPGWSGG